MKIHKVNYKNCFLFAVMVIFVCLLKMIYISNSMYETSIEFVHDIVVYWGNNQLVNFIWFIPIITNLFFVSKTYYSKAINFSTRYKNRCNFISYTIKESLLYSFVYNFLSVLMQTFVLTVLLKANIHFSFAMLELFISYSIECTFLNFVVLFFAIYSKHYMYSFLAVIILCIMVLTVLGNNMYIPFVCLYSSYKINYITVVSLLGLIILIQKKYLTEDLIGGYENDFRN